MAKARSLQVEWIVTQQKLPESWVFGSPPQPDLSVENLFLVWCVSPEVDIVDVRSMKTSISLTWDPPRWTTTLNLGRGCGFNSY